MRERRVSEEERRQREKEERTRARRQDELFEETRRSVYARISQEQGAPPEDREPPYRNGPEEVFDEEEAGDLTRRKRRMIRRIVLTLLLLLAVGAAVVLAVHGALIRQPELPPAEEPSAEEEEGVAPSALGAGRRDGVYTFLLVGRDDGGGGNTDTIMVLCFDAENGTLDALSIYRDTLVDVPWEIKKINSVYNMQGLEGLQEQIRNLIGYQPDYSLVLELSALTELVDAIGGVDFEVPYNMDYDDPTQDLHIHLAQGMQHLDGEEAVKVLRWRKNNSGESLSVGDVGRVEIQHSFLKAMAAQTLRLENLGKFRQIASIVDRKVTTNLTYGEMLWFGEHALGLQAENVRFHGLPGDYTGTLWSPTYRNYQSYVFVNDQALLELINQYMNPYRAEITPDMQHVIHGTTVNNQPELPAGTGLPVTGAEEEDLVELPTGGSLTGAPLPADAVSPTGERLPSELNGYLSGAGSQTTGVRPAPDQTARTAAQGSATVSAAAVGQEPAPQSGETVPEEPEVPGEDAGGQERETGDDVPAAPAETAPAEEVPDAEE